LIVFGKTALVSAFAFLGRIQRLIGDVFIELRCFFLADPLNLSLARCAPRDHCTEWTGQHEGGNVSRSLFDVVRRQREELGTEPGVM
jgi:hypothetical protein